MRKRNHQTQQRVHQAGDAVPSKRERLSPIMNKSTNQEFTIIDLVKIVDRLQLSKTGEAKECVQWNDVRKQYKKMTGHVLGTDVLNHLAGKQGESRREIICGTLGGLLQPMDPHANTLRYCYDPTKGDPLINHRYTSYLIGGKKPRREKGDISPRMQESGDSAQAAKSDTDTTSSAFSPTCLSSISTDPDSASPASALSPLLDAHLHSPSDSISDGCSSTDAVSPSPLSEFDLPQSIDNHGRIDLPQEQESMDNHGRTESSISQPHELVLDDIDDNTESSLSDERPPSSFNVSPTEEDPDALGARFELSNEAPLELSPLPTPPPVIFDSQRPSYQSPPPTELGMGLHDIRHVASPNTSEYLTAVDGDDSFLTAKTSPMTSDWDTSPGRGDSTTPVSPGSTIDDDHEKTIAVPHTPARDTVDDEETDNKSSSKVMEETIEKDTVSIDVKSTVETTVDHKVEHEEESDKENVDVVSSIKEEKDEIGSNHEEVTNAIKEEHTVDEVPSKESLIETSAEVSSPVTISSSDEAVTTVIERVVIVKEEEAVAVDGAVEEDEETNSPGRDPQPEAVPIVEEPEDMEVDEHHGEGDGEDMVEDNGDGDNVPLRVPVHDMAAGDAPLSFEEVRMKMVEMEMREEDRASSVTLVAAPPPHTTGDDTINHEDATVPTSPPVVSHHDDAEMKHTVDGDDGEDRSDIRENAPWVTATIPLVEEMTVVKEEGGDRVGDDMEEGVTKEDEEMSASFTYSLRAAEEHRVLSQSPIHLTTAVSPLANDDTTTTDSATQITVVASSDRAAPAPASIVDHNTSQMTSSPPVAVPRRTTPAADEEREAMEAISLSSRSSTASGNGPSIRPVSPSSEMGIDDVLAMEPVSITAPITLKRDSKVTVDHEDDEDDVITHQPTATVSKTIVPPSPTVSPPKDDCRPETDLALRPAQPQRKFPCCSIL